MVPLVDVQTHTWDVYKQAVAVVERRGVPVAGLSVDCRSLDHLVQRYNDGRIRSLERAAAVG